MNLVVGFSAIDTPVRPEAYLKAALAEKAVKVAARTQRSTHLKTTRDLIARKINEGLITDFDFTLLHETNCAR